MMKILINFIKINVFYFAQGEVKDYCVILNVFTLEVVHRRELPLFSSKLLTRTVTKIIVWTDNYNPQCCCRTYCRTMWNLCEFSEPGFSFSIRYLISFDIVNVQVQRMSIYEMHVLKLQLVKHTFLNNTVFIRRRSVCPWKFSRESILAEISQFVLPAMM